jgi:hypothetical protein
MAKMTFLPASIFTQPKVAVGSHVHIPPVCKGKTIDKSCKLLGQHLSCTPTTVPHRFIGVDGHPHTVNVPMALCTHYRVKL